MTEPESPEPLESAPRTQWHPMLIALLERYCVETSKAAEVDRRLFSFSRGFLAHPDAVRRLDREELRVYFWLSRQVEQFRRARGTMATKDNEEFEKAQHEALKSLVSMLSAEERLAGLPAEQLLAALTPEQIEELKRLLH
ncbi:MAG: hypothetical protein ABJE95_07310 [Byssovorax sp.]